jgi:hypothetical protein
MLHTDACAYPDASAIRIGRTKVEKKSVKDILRPHHIEKLTSGKPWRHSMPTNPNFVVADEREFEKERKQLIALVQRFPQSGPSAITKEAHPFFGKMNPQEWSTLQWNHLNHHLTQFGV